MHLKNIFKFYALLTSALNCYECALFYPASSAYGIFAAIAVPLDLPQRNVFVSYNFEGNYNMPATWDIPPVFNGVEEDGEFDSARKIKAHVKTQNSTDSGETDYDEHMTTSELPTDEQTTAKEAHARSERSLLSRTNVYHILKDNFQRSGFNGEACLLRLICETNASELGEVNGVLGSLIHVLFSPSTSANENLDLAYYQAEYDGWHDQCHYYEENCEESILDLISSPFHKIFEQYGNNKNL